MCTKPWVGIVIWRKTNLKVRGERGWRGGRRRERERELEERDRLEGHLR